MQVLKLCNHNYKIIDDIFCSSAYNSLDDDLSDTKHWISSQSNFEPNTDHVKSHSFDGMTTNRVISHFSDAKGEKVEKEPEVKGFFFML